MSFIHTSRIFQKFKKCVVIIVSCLLIAGHQRPHLKQDYLVVPVNGKFNIKSQSIHNMLQLPYCQKQFFPWRRQPLRLNIPDDLHHPSGRAAGHTVCRPGLIIIDQIIWFVTLDIAGEDHTPEHDISGLTLNQHLFFFQIVNIPPIGRNDCIHRINDLLLTGRIHIQNTFIMSRIRTLERIFCGGRASYHNPPSPELIHDLMADADLISVVVSHLQNIHFLNHRLMDQTS